MSKTRIKPVHVLGPGALGLVFSHQLSARHRVTLVTKPTHPTAYSYTFAQHTTPLRVDVASAVKEPITELWLFTKAHQCKSALFRVLEHLHPNANIILSHNGMTDVAELADLLSPTQGLYFMLTQQAAYKNKTDDVIHVSQGPSTIGAVNHIAKTRLDSLLCDWQCAIPLLSKSNDIFLARWQKLLINLAINPIATYYNELNGALTSPRYASDVFALLNEAINVGGKEGVELHLSDALAQAYKVMANTAGNRCSMLQDKLGGRETEIDAMCGYVVTLARQHGLATPVNELYYQRIKVGKP
ncbi:ketopantoate reductase family protein [Pseudoalteromonas sp. GB56]